MLGTTPAARATSGKRQSAAESPERAAAAARQLHACRHRRRKRRQRTHSGSLGFAAGLCRRAERGGALKATKAQHPHTG